ncbi:hypothetical protein ILYODFUR_007830 [Ilyodon furcidens]|uniref:BTB domain-containing protein n=1 Tax=Ilyodon furcidens TaxID=33524 RepID=A0ABV0SKK5_9TELE
MTGVASPEKAASSKKKSERKSASKEEYRQLSSIMAGMNTLRKQGTLCDVTLVVQGKHFSAHRVVLAAASHFFSLMFTSKHHTQTHTKCSCYDGWFIERLAK